MVTKQAGQAESQEEIAPLVELCKTGRLFDVQKWIADGKPVNPPTQTNARKRKKGPLEYAMELGFHSLVEVLLEGGADANTTGHFCPMNCALSKRRFDFVQLLVEHGYDPVSVDMREVFWSWDPEIMEFFIDRGADVETGMPLAEALCDRIRTALRVLKRYRDRFPSFQEQANVALRHHCLKGNLKWVSLMLWAGADPLAPGDHVPGDVGDDEEGGLSALGFAALYENFEVFSLKSVKIPIDHPVARDVMGYCCRGEGLKILQRLLAKGLNPNDLKNGGCSAIQSHIEQLEWSDTSYLYGWQKSDRGIDTGRAREGLKAIHLLAKHGGRWRPVDAYRLNSARRSLLKMTPDYTTELVWIFSKYAAASKADVEALLRTPTIKRHIAKHRERISELLDDWPESAAVPCAESEVTS